MRESKGSSSFLGGYNLFVDSLDKKRQISFSSKSIYPKEKEIHIIFKESTTPEKARSKSSNEQNIRRKNKILNLIQYNEKNVLKTEGKIINNLDFYAINNEDSKSKNSNELNSIKSFVSKSK